MPQSKVAVRMKISFSCFANLTRLLERADDHEIGKHRQGEPDQHAEARAKVAADP